MKLFAYGPLEAEPPVQAVSDSIRKGMPHEENTGGTGHCRHLGLIGHGARPCPARPRCSDCWWPDRRCHRRWRDRIEPLLLWPRLRLLRPRQWLLWTRPWTLLRWSSLCRRRARLLLAASAFLGRLCLADSPRSGLRLRVVHI